MRLYTYSEAKENLSMLLDIAQNAGAVAIQRKDGSTFVLRPGGRESIPPDLKGIDLGMTTDEIVALIREMRGGPLPDIYEPPSE